ncbi:hypothetical protein B1759_12760 [Rubrivirga sp. SAORIC476]|nr:hypothetical protein B1759_12760 [Rubrivirga sp. SAORIC476]
MWVPVSKPFFDQFFPEADNNSMVEDGILLMKEHQFTRGKSREWKIPPEVMDRARWLMVADLEAEFVDPKTGRKKGRPQKHKTTNEYGKPHPLLVKQAIHTFEYGYFNRAAVEEHLREREDSVSYAESLGVEEEIPGWLERPRARLDGDIRCYSVILRQKPQLVEGTTYRYRLAYSVQSTGRLSQRGGGAQSCSREMKARLYRDLEGVPEVLNYDLKSSQAYILRAFLSDAGIDTSWLDTYLSADKQMYADRAGLTVDTWKAIFYALVMGAHLPNSLYHSDGAVKWGFYDEFGVSTKDEIIGPELSPVFASAADALKDTREVLQPFSARVKEWHRYLEEEWVPQNAEPNRTGRLVRNALQMKFHWTREIGDERENIREAKRKLAAFLLQGKEAAFIHRLTTILPDYGVVPISNEHDGIVTLGVVPPEAIERAREAEDMPYAKLETKDFV